jgi:DNA-binding YbaB/EbfC family protein
MTDNHSNNDANDEVDDTPIRADEVVQGGGLADPGEGHANMAGEDPLAALLGGGAGGAGGLDFGALLEQASSMQAQLLAAQQQAQEQSVTGVAGGGVVKVEVTGAFEFRAVTIDPEAVDPDDVEMLQDLVLAALHDAVEQVQDLQSGSLDLGGMDLGGMDLGGLLGGNG